MEPWRTLAEPTYGIDYNGHAKRLGGNDRCRFADPEEHTTSTVHWPGTVVLEVKDPSGHSWGSWFYFVTESAVHFNVEPVMRDFERSRRG